MDTLSGILTKMLKDSGQKSLDRICIIISRIFESLNFHLR